MKNETESYKNIIKNRAAKELESLSFQLELLNEKLNSHNYIRQLEKGFALVSDNEGNIIRKINQVEIEGILNIRFKDFKIQAETINIKEVE